jgi:predicted RNA-binding protein YlxR (DUF448 family)
MKTSFKDKVRQQPKRRKHIPQRTCVACREIKGKKNLIRLVNNAGVIEIDPTHKKPGRGAYLCPTVNCWELGLKGNRLEYTLRTKLTPGDRQILQEYSKSLS